jgi:hypothetical protein
MTRRTASETVLSARDAGTAAQTNKVKLIQSVDNVPIGDLDELRVRFKQTQQAAGTMPTMNLKLQRLVTGGVPVLATDDMWEDFYAFPEIAAAAVQSFVVSLPLPLAQDVDGSLGSYSRAYAQGSLAADTVLAGHWLGPIRVIEIVGGTVTTSVIYNLEFVGRKIG